MISHPRTLQATVLPPLRQNQLCMGMPGLVQLLLDTIPPFISSLIFQQHMILDHKRRAVRAEHLIQPNRARTVGGTATSFGMKSTTGLATVP